MYRGLPAWTYHGHWVNDACRSGVGAVSPTLEGGLFLVGDNSTRSTIYFETILAPFCLAVTTINHSLDDNSTTTT